MYGKSSTRNTIGPSRSRFSKLFTRKATSSDLTLDQAASENTRITSVHSVESTDSAEDQKLLLTAAVTRPYYSILSTSRGAVSRILQVPDTCVLNCAQSWMLGTSHYFALRSGPGRMIVRVDGRTGTSQTVSSIAADARGIDLGHHESVALGMPTHDTIFALWRTANQGLMLKTFMFDGQRWVSAAQDLGLVYRQRAGTI